MHRRQYVTTYTRKRTVVHDSLNVPATSDSASSRGDVSTGTGRSMPMAFKLTQRIERSTILRITIANIIVGLTGLNAQVAAIGQR
jgi:predicted secreted protein